MIFLNNRLTHSANINFPMQTVNSKLNCMGSKPHKHKYIDYTTRDKCLNINCNTKTASHDKHMTIT